MTELITRCQCRNVGPGDPGWDCGNPMTQEDLLCDACRAGCNAGVRGEDGKPGHHFLTTDVQLQWFRDGHWTNRISIRAKGTL